MGLGMGGTMMPIMTSALQTLKDAEIARGSTLMNITQQVAASIGTALFSVLLTNGFNASDCRPATAWRGPRRVSSRSRRSCRRRLADMADAFGDVFLVATVLVALCLVPAFLLPRRRPARTSPLDGDPATPPVLMH